MPTRLHPRCLVPLVCTWALGVSASEPQLHASGPVGALASHGQDVFWEVDGKIVRLSPSATEGQPIFELARTETVKLFADGVGVIAAASGQDRSIVIAWHSADQRRVEVATGDGEIVAVGADATTVYWLTIAPDVGGRGSLLAAPRSGGALRTLADRLHDPWSLALDDDHLYITTMGSAFQNPLGRPDGTVIRVSKARGRTTILFGGQFEPDNLMVRGDRLYWSDGRAVRGTRARSGLWTGKTSGGKARRLARIDDVVSDLGIPCDGRVVFALPGNPRSEAETEGGPVPRGSIWALSTRGGDLVPITQRPLPRPMHLVTHDRALWWVDGDGLWSLPLAEVCPPVAAPQRRD